MEYQAELTRESFNFLFEEYLTVSKTNKEAYEEAEKLHLEAFGKTKYNDYLTFKASRSRYMRKKRLTKFTND